MGKKRLLTAAGIAAVAGPIVFGVLNAPAIRAQSALASRPKFEVASIRSGCTRGGDSSPGRLTLNCISVKGLISRAYDLYASGPLVLHIFSPVEGGPDWINSEQYDINAKAEGNANSDLMNGPMLQTLLEDRFKLKIHRETREVPGFALTGAKGGPKLEPFVEGTCVPYVTDSTLPPGKHFCDRAWLTGASSVTMNFVGASMTTLAQDLSYRVGRPVVDRTGVAGLHDFRLDFAPDESTPTLHPIANSDASGTSIFTALQEQLRLRLESAKGVGEFLVIDHIERPTEN
jgi:uncharacterized protein (TIGR03435 family)